MKVVAEARDWFLNEDESGDFAWVCERAELDPARIRRIALDVIHARVTGDHTNVPEFWSKAFRRNRAPAVSWLEKQILTTPAADPLDEL